MFFEDDLPDPDFIVDDNVHVLFLSSLFLAIISYVFFS